MSNLNSSLTLKIPYMARINSIESMLNVDDFGMPIDKKHFWDKNLKIQEVLSFNPRFTFL